jgi:hypothetical protein
MDMKTQPNMFLSMSMLSYLITYFFPIIFRFGINNDKLLGTIWDVKKKEGERGEGKRDFALFGILPFG